MNHGEHPDDVHPLLAAMRYVAISDNETADGVAAGLSMSEVYQLAYRLIAVAKRVTDMAIGHDAINGHVDADPITRVQEYDPATLAYVLHGEEWMRVAEVELAAVGGGTTQSAARMVTAATLAKWQLVSRLTLGSGSWTDQLAADAAAVTNVLTGAAVAACGATDQDEEHGLVFDPITLRLVTDGQTLQIQIRDIGAAGARFGHRGDGAVTDDRLRQCRSLIRGGQFASPPDLGTLAWCELALTDNGQPWGRADPAIDRPGRG